MKTKYIYVSTLLILIYSSCNFYGSKNEIERILDKENIKFLNEFTKGFAHIYTKYRTITLIYENSLIQTKIYKVDYNKGGACFFAFFIQDHLYFTSHKSLLPPIEEQLKCLTPLFFNISFIEQSMDLKEEVLKEVIPLVTIDSKIIEKKIVKKKCSVKVSPKEGIFVTSSIKSDLAFVRLAYNFFPTQANIIKLDCAIGQ